MFIKRRQAGPASTCTLLIFSLSETDKLPELGGEGEWSVRFMKVNIATSAPTSLDKVEYWKCGPMKERRERERESLIRSHWLEEEERGWNGSRAVSVFIVCVREIISLLGRQSILQLYIPCPSSSQSPTLSLTSTLCHRVTQSQCHILILGGKTALPVICPDMIRRSRVERSASSSALWTLSCCWPDFEKHWVVSLMRLSCRPGGRWHSRPLRMPHILSVGLAESPCPGLCWECWLK